MRSRASAKLNSQYGFCSRVNLGAAASTWTRTRAVTGSLWAPFRISVSVINSMAVLIDQSLFEPGVGIDTSVAQKWPVRSMFVYAIPFHIGHDNFFSIYRTFRDD